MRGRKKLLGMDLDETLGLIRALPYRARHSFTFKINVTNVSFKHFVYTTNRA